MARTHPLTGVSTVAPTPAPARHCLLPGPAALSQERLPLSASRVREGFSIGFKCSEAFSQPISETYPVDTRVMGGVSRVLGGNLDGLSRVLGGEPCD